MKIIFILASVLLLSGCPDKAEQKPEYKERVYNPWKTQMEALDKAKNMQNQLQQDAKERDRLMREQGG